MSFLNAKQSTANLITKDIKEICISYLILQVIILMFFFLFLFTGSALAKMQPILGIWNDSPENITQGEIEAPLPCANPDAPKGGTVTSSMVGTFDNLNPFSPRGIAPYQVILTYDTLAEPIPSKSGFIRGVLAENFELAPDRSWLRVTLRPEARFSDNTPVTAHDVVYTFNALRAEASPTYRAAYKDVLEVKAESDHELLFKFAPNSSRALALNVCQLPVLSKRWLENRDMGAPFKKPFIASGPYKVKEFTFGSQIILERRKDYWAQNMPTHRGRNNFDFHRIDYYRDATVARQAFLAGNSDYYSEGSIKDWIHGYDAPAVKEGRIEKIQFFPNRTVGIMGIVLNTRNPILADKNVRHALSLLMDFEWINTALFFNTYQRCTSFFSGHKLNTTLKPTKEELAILSPFKNQLDPAVFGDLPKIPVTDGSGNIRAQMLQAVELLKKSGWELQDGVMLNKKGEPLRLTLIANSSNTQRIYGRYKNTLKRMGIELTIQLMDQTQYISRVRSFDYDLCYAFVPQGPNPGNEQRYYWGSKAAKQKGSRNHAGVSDPVIDAVIEMLVSAKSQKEAKLYTRLLDRLLLHGMYIIPGWYNPQIRIGWWQERIAPGKKDAIAFTSLLNCWHKSLSK